MLQHMKALGWTLSDRLVITRRHGTTVHLTKGEDQLFDLAQRRFEKSNLVHRCSSVKQSRPTRNCRNKH